MAKTKKTTKKTTLDLEKGVVTRDVGAVQNDVLVFIPDAKVLMKVQPGTGDNLLAEDMEEGFTDYFLWSTFKPEYMGIDEELEMQCLDGGMYMVKEAFEPTEKYIGDCIEQAFGKKLDYITLFTEED